MASRMIKGKKIPKKRAKKTSPKRAQSPKRAKKPSVEMEEVLVNQQIHWEAYKELRQRVDQAWAKLQTDIEQKVHPALLVRDKNDLLLLLGECNYMAREGMRYQSYNGRKKR